MAAECCLNVHASVNGGYIIGKCFTAHACLPPPAWALTRYPVFSSTRTNFQQLCCFVHMTQCTQAYIVRRQNDTPCIMQCVSLTYAPPHPCCAISYEVLVPAPCLMPHYVRGKIGGILHLGTHACMRYVHLVCIQDAHCAQQG